MKSLLKGIQAWRSRRQQRWVKRWEQTRTEGKRRFVFRTALTNGLTIVGAAHVYHHLFYGYPSIHPVKLILFVLAGVYGASNAWSTMEGKYQIARHKARAKALQGSKNSPDVFK